jgi:hypothetical protein
VYGHRTNHASACLECTLSALMEFGCSWSGLQVSLKLSTVYLLYSSKYAPRSRMLISFNSILIHIIADLLGTQQQQEAAKKTSVVEPKM